MYWKVFTQLTVSLLLCVSAWAETRVIKQGEPAPYDGLLFNEEAARQAVEDVRDRASLSSQKETLQAEIKVLQEQKAQLESALGSKDRALELAEQRDQLRADIEERMRRALEMNERSMKLATEAAEVSIKAAQASTAALEKMQEKVDRANQRGFWGAIGSAILGLFAGFSLIP